MGPLAVILFLLGIAMYAIVNGLGTRQMITAMGITAILTGFLVIGWQRLGRSFGADWWLSTGHAPMILFAFAVFCFYFIAPYITNNLQFTVLPLTETGAGAGSVSVLIVLGILFLGIIGMFAFGSRTGRRM
jgi:hypothetical protein